MKKTTLTVISLLILLTGCAESPNVANEKTSEANDFCLIFKPEYGDGITRKYFKYKNNENSDPDCSNYYLKEGSIKYGNPLSYDEHENEIGNPDPKTFRLISREAAKDRYNVYVSGEKIDGIADSESFILLGDSRYAKDSYNVYYDMDKLKQADPTSFFIEQNCFAQDKAHLYYCGELIEGADLNTFEEMGDGYYKDKDFVFYKYDYGRSIRRITGSDSESFKFIENGYTRDRNQIYYQGVTLEGVDIESFETIKDDFFTAKDRSNFYIGAGKRDKKSEIRNFIEVNLLKASGDPCILGCDNASAVDLDVARKDDVLNIIAQFNGTLYISPFWKFAESEVADFFLPRKDEAILRRLEEKLNEKFGIKEITVFYKSTYKKLTRVYENHHFVYEDIILGVSPDGRYAELSFYLDGLIHDTGSPYDMLTGEKLNQYDKMLCHNLGCEDSENVLKEYESRIEKDRRQLGIYALQSPGDAFFQNTVKIDDTVQLISKEIDYPTGAKNEWGDPIGDYANMLNVNYYDESTRTEVTVLTIDEPKCILSPIGFYGHKDMQGILFIYMEGGCVWSSGLISILPQNLLDQKLAELYNGIGMHYYDEEGYKTAVTYFDKAIGIQKDYAQAYYNKACVLALLDDVPRAIESLKISVGLESAKFKNKAKTDKDFDGIRENNEFRGLING